MATASNILKNFNIYIDGRGFAGVADTIELPELNLIMEEARYGGMDGKIKHEMGQEAMTCSIVLSGYDRGVLKLWGLGQGSRVPITARGALESFDGSIEAVAVNMNGIIGSLKFGEWKAGEKSTITIPVELYSYKYTQGGEVIHDIDVPNMVRIVGGVDRLAAQRNALGI